MGLRRLYAVFLVCVMTVGMAVTQEACPMVVQEILDSVAESCASLGRNEICYGNNNVTAMDDSNTVIASFNSSGDLISVLDTTSLITVPFDPALDEWGVAVMSLQADFPDTLPGQNVTIVVFGDVAIDSANESLQAFSITTGIGQPECADMPPDGVLIQVPSDTSVALAINGIEMVFGSTGFVQVDGDEVTVSTVDGIISMTADNETQTAEVGYSVSASSESAPSDPEPYDYDSVVDVPIELLPEAVSVPFPVSSNGGWIDSGIEVSAGDVVEFSATGMVNVWVACEAQKVEAGQPDIDCTSLIFDADGGDVRTVDGITLGSDMSLFPVDDAPPHSLVGRVGDETFFVGTDSTITIETDGTLEFRLNDVDDNNAGAFIVTITTVVNE